MEKDSQLQQRYKKYLAIRREQDIEAQIGEAEQIVHSMPRVDSGKAFMQVQRRIQMIQNRFRVLNILIKAAAILFIPLLISSVFVFLQLRIQSDSGLFAFQKISNPSGIRSEIILPDGSKVWLNAESTINYRIPFGLKERDVKLTGEAFFEVKRDELKPFFVESGKVKVTVLGTRFNCKSFPEDKAVEIVLAEGAVRLNTTSSETEKEFILKPGERAVVDKMTNQISISSENVEKYIGWHEGRLIFDECPLSEVGRRLERWFGVEIEIDDSRVLDYQISTTFERESLSQILSMLELASPIKIEVIRAATGKTIQAQKVERVIITGKD